jgi:hypothetical protein
MDNPPPPKKKSVSQYPSLENFTWGSMFAISASVKIDASKFSELCLLDRQLLSTKSQIINSCFYWLGKPVSIFQLQLPKILH